MKTLKIIFILLFCGNQIYAQELMKQTEPIQEKIASDSVEKVIGKKSAEILDTTNLISQQNTKQDTGELIIEKGENFDLLLQEYLEQKEVSGYRIQLFSGGKRIDALKVKVDFMKLYSEQEPNIIYQQPNYKVRVGNYRNRLDANKNLQLYQIDFPEAFIIKDFINLENQTN